MSTNDTQVRETYVAVVLNGRSSLNPATLQLCRAARKFRCALLVGGAVGSDLVIIRIAVDSKRITADTFTLATRDTHSGTGTLMPTGCFIVFPGFSSIQQTRIEHSAINAM